jgi:hypothetical protein
MPRKLPRSRLQLEKTSHWRKEVFDFMRRFEAQHLWTINGPPDTDVDEMFCFAYQGGVALIQTWEHGGWSAYTEPTADQTYDGVEAAMRLQIEERQRGTDAPLSGMWVKSLVTALIPRMSDDTIKEVSDMFDTALRDATEATGVRIPVEGMTPNGFPEHDSPDADTDDSAKHMPAGLID